MRQLADDATAAHRHVVPVCGRVVGASVAAFTAAASPALSDPRAVLMIDAFEHCGELEGWLREQFLPQLPDSVLAVLAAPHPPEQAWCVDPSWSSALLVRGLGDLTQAEAFQLLESRGVPADARESVVAFAGRHPLALSVAAETARRCDRHASRQRGRYPNLRNRAARAQALSAGFAVSTHVRASAGPVSTPHRARTWSAAGSTLGTSHEAQMRRALHTDG
jgi:hypothetical protein